MGGVFDSSASDTFTQVTKAQWNGTEEEIPGGNFIFFNDKIHYGASSSSDGFPILMNSPGVTIPGGLPLGMYSTFLQEAYDSEMAPSTAYGLHTGSRSISSPSDGLLIIGGYDGSAIDGELTEFEYDPSCPTCIEVESITYETPDSSTSLLDEPMIVALETYLRTLNVPQSAFDTFQEATGSSWDEDLQFLVHPPDQPLGELVVKLSNGFTSIVPASDLFTKPRFYNDDGVYEITDHDTTLAVFANDTETPTIQTWGLPYLSQHYLVVDHAGRQWKMAKAKKSSAIEDLQDLLDNTSDIKTIEAICAPDDNGSKKKGENNGLSPGLIAGIVAGAVVLLALIAFAVWLFLRRRRRTAAAGSSDTAEKKEGKIEDLQQHPPPSYQAHDPKQPAVAEMAAPIATTGPQYGVSEMASPEQMSGQMPWGNAGNRSIGAAMAHEMESPVVSPEATGKNRFQQQGLYEMP